jgi:protein required for attachment to host cells
MGAGGQARETTMNGKLWIVIAHQGGARVFEFRGHGQPLAPMRTLDHPEGRLHANERASDAPGETFDRAGSGRHAKSSEETPEERAANDFARRVADALRADRVAGRYERLALVAGPRFLGRLRAALDPPTAALVTGTLDRDLARVADADLAPHLDALLRPA